MKPDPGPVTPVPAWRRHLAFAAVLAVVVLGLVRIVQYHWREGTTIIAGALLLAAGLRMLLPPQRSGLLAIRSRGVDVLLYGGFGLMVLYVALTIVGGPLAEG